MAPKLRGKYYIIMLKYIIKFEKRMLDISALAMHQKIVILILSIVLSFVILMIATSFLEQHFLSLNKCCGQWMEEMVSMDNTRKTGEKYIGIGIIRYDRKTKNHNFVGRTHAYE